MAERIIPPKTKQRMQLVLGLNWIDLLVLAGFMGLALLILNLTMPEFYKVLIAIIILITGAFAMLPVKTYRIYKLLIMMFQYWLRNKTINGFTLKEINVVFNEDHVVAGEMKHMVFEVDGIDFGILTEEKQDFKINRFARLLQAIPNGKIVKLDKAIDFSGRIAELLNDIELFLTDRVKYENQIKLIENQIDLLMYYQEESVSKVETYYFIVYEKDYNDLLQKSLLVREELYQIGLENKLLENEKLKEFYELYFDKKFEDDDLSIPDIKENISSVEFGNEKLSVLTIDSLPLYCVNNWLYGLFSVPNTKVTLNFNVSSNKTKIIRNVDKTIMELQTRLEAKKITPSKVTELQTQIDSLMHLINQLKLDAEELHNVNIYVLAPESEIKHVKEALKNISCMMNTLPFEQLTSFINCMPYNSGNEVTNSSKELQSTSLAASFPFVTKLINEDNGVYLGYNGYPIFFNPFATWEGTASSRRKNCNMFSAGAPGSGKSHYTKLLLMKRILKGTTVYTFDPEDEYKTLCKSLNGEMVDVGGVGSGIINPLQIYPTLNAEPDEEDFELGYVSNHQQFLQEFFKTVMPELDNDASISLRICIKELYNSFNITDANSTKIVEMDPTQFPTIEDLVKIIETKLESYVDSNNEYELTNYRRLNHAFYDFKKGGLHSKLWNGHTTLKLKSNFTVFNFQSLFSSSNELVANGQMLLVMRFLMQEIIKNKNINEKNGTRNTVIVSVDEAHAFINPDFPIALRFMKDMAKRIRKYGGSLMMQTQNIKDFVGHSEKTRALATAVINNCQYKCIFSLEADDLKTFAELYGGDGGVNSHEIDFIRNAGVGEMLLMIDSETRVLVKVSSFEGEEKFI